MSEVLSCRRACPLLPNETKSFDAAVTERRAARKTRMPPPAPEEVMQALKALGVPVADHDHKSSTGSFRAFRLENRMKSAKKLSDTRIYNGEFTRRPPASAMGPQISMRTGNAALADFWDDYMMMTTLREGTPRSYSSRPPSGRDHVQEFQSRPPSSRDRSASWLANDVQSNFGGGPLLPPPSQLSPRAANARASPRPFISARAAMAAAADAHQLYPRSLAPPKPRLGPNAPHVGNPLPLLPLSPRMGLSQQNFSPPKVDQADAVQQMRNNIERNFKTMQDAFLALDKDRSGAIDREEMKHAVARWNLPLPGPTVDALMDACDADGSGGVDYREFINVLSRDNHVYKSSQLTKEKLN